MTNIWRSAISVAETLIRTTQISTIPLGARSFARIARDVKPKKSKSKRKRQKVHVKKRLRQRHGIDATKYILAEITELVRSQPNDNVLLLSDGYMSGPRHSCRTHIYNVQYMKQWIRLVYDVDQEKLLTALPPKPHDEAEATVALKEDLDVNVVWREL